MCDTILFILLYLALFHDNSRLLRWLLRLIRFDRFNNIFLIRAYIDSTRFNWMGRVCCTFRGINHIYGVILWLLLIVCSPWVGNHYNTPLFCVAFVTFALLRELWFTLLLLLNIVSRFWVYFSGCCTLFSKNLSRSVDWYVLVGIFVIWVNSLDLELN